MLNIIHHSLHDGQLPYGGACCAVPQVRLTSEMDASNCVIDRMSVASRGMLPLRYVSPTRSLLSNALNFRWSAIAAFVRSP
jgi:hypothetical protein